MRKSVILFPLLLMASPAFAQNARSAADTVQVQRVLDDPATADRLADMMQVLSKAVLDVQVGQLKAATEGREATPAERKLTVRDLGRRDNPNFDRDVERQVAQARPMMRQSMKALSDALPAMMRGLQQASDAIERAAANMPDPTYPKR
jgi:hypothetical protein